MHACITCLLRLYRSASASVGRMSRFELGSRQLAVFWCPDACCCVVLCGLVWSCVAWCGLVWPCVCLLAGVAVCHVACVWKIASGRLRLEDRLTLSFFVSASTLTTTRSAWLVLWYHEHEEGVLEAQVSTTASTPTTSSAASAASAPQRLAAPAAMAPCEPAGFSASASIRWWIWACI